MHIITLAACAAMGIFVVSCTSGSTSNTGTTGAGTTGAGSSAASSTGAGGASAAVIDMFCNSLAKPFCDADYACCTDFVWLSGHWRDQCEQAFLGNETTFCERPYTQDRTFLEASLEAGTTIFDQAQFDACLALLKSMSAEGAACLEPPHYTMISACLRAFQGQITPGDACASTSYFSDYDQYATFPCKDGRCEKGKCLPFLKTGDACTLPQGTYLPANKLCNYVNQAGCIGALGDGGAAFVGTCGPQRELGDACHSGNDDECKSRACDDTGKCATPNPQTIACKVF